LHRAFHQPIDVGRQVGGVDRARPARRGFPVAGRRRLARRQHGRWTQRQHGRERGQQQARHGFPRLARGITSHQARPARAAGSMLVAAVAVDVAVLDLDRIGFAHLDDLDVEVQVLAGHRVVEIDVDHAQAHLLHGHRARAEVGVEHHLLARGQLLRAEVLLGHALDQALAALAVGFGGGHVDAEALAGLAPVHRLLQARDDVAVPDQDRQWLPALLRRLQRFLADFGDGVVETDDAVFLDLHGARSRGAGRDLSGRNGPCRMQRMRSNRTRPATDDGAAHYPVSTTPAPTPRPTTWGLTGLLALFVVLAGCGRDQVRPGPPPAATPPAREWPVVPPSDPAAANAVLMRAISLVGTPYRYGGNTPEGGFDCSGLVNYV